MSKYRLSRAAEVDIEQILRETKRLFGTRQQHIYAVLIERAARMIAEKPDRSGSRDRPDLGLRSFHVELAASRLGAASHCLYYEADTDHAGHILILRVLHEQMEPRLHIARVMDPTKPSEAK